MRQGRPKMAQPASKLNPDGPKWAHLEPLLPTLEALLATWGVPLRIFMHFYEVFVNNCAFFLKIHGNPRKIKQIALKFMTCTKTQKTSLKVSKNAPMEAKNGPTGDKSEPG